MNVRDICKRDVVAVQGSDELVTAAQKMRDEHIGYLVVVDDNGSGRDPIGVLTDRDIVIAVVARGVDPRSLKVEDLMTRNPIVVKEEDPIEAALHAMRTIGVRRMPVVSLRGHLTGVLSLDDVLEGLADELGTIAASIRNERRFESTLRPSEDR
jgi:predicted transcriptional regulator